MGSNEDEHISTDHLSDKAKYDFILVQRAVKSSDQQAFAELMDRYRDSIFFMLLKMINNRDDAEDLTPITANTDMKIALSANAILILMLGLMPSGLISLCLGALGVN